MMTGPIPQKRRIPADAAHPLAATAAGGGFRQPGTRVSIDRNERKSTRSAEQEMILRKCGQMQSPDYTTDRLAEGKKITNI